MIRPLPSYSTSLQAGAPSSPYVARTLPRIDRALDAVERAILERGIDNPQKLRSPRPIEEVLSPRALPEGTLLVLSDAELAATVADIEDTVRDERLGGTVFTTLPHLEELGKSARGLRELAHTAKTFGFNPSLRPLPSQRMGKVAQIPLPLHLRSYRFLLADTPGFRVMMISRTLPGGGWIALWSGNEHLVAELRAVLSEAASAAGHNVPEPSPEVPPLEDIESSEDVWRRAKELRAYRVVREAELREIARQAALRGVQIRREREAAKRKAAGA